MKQHLGTARTVAAGLRVLPHSASAWAAAQGAWRFYQNPRVSLPQLAEPLLAQGRKAVADECAAYALVVHDWSPLGYKRHGSKRDRIAVSHADDLGDELQTALVVSDQTGAPLAPLYLGVRAAQGVYSSRRERPLPARPHLAELSRTLNYVASVGLAKPAVHIVDREADAVRHLRRWHRRGHYVLIRAQMSRLVRYQGQEQRLSAVVAQLQASLGFSRAVEYKGQQAAQYVTEAEVTLHRVAKVRRPHTQGREREHIAGPPLPLRLIVSEVRSPEGVVLAQWWLWTNLPAEVSASTVALWYYWRWRIESFFKLLKGAGQHLEQWQQERAAALAKRLMVAVQACVLVWALARADGPQAAATRRCLIRLSGRLMKRSRPWTEPALLAGLWHLLVLLEVVERYPLQDLRAMAAQVLPPGRLDPHG